MEKQLQRGIRQMNRSPIHLKGVDVCGSTESASGCQANNESQPATIG